MSAVKNYTEEELNKISREDFIKVVTDSVREANEAKEELAKAKEETEKVKKDKDYWFTRYSEADAAKESLEKQNALLKQQRDAAIQAASNIIFATTQQQQPITQE